jgi:hypothetical protein
MRYDHSFSVELQWYVEKNVLIIDDEDILSNDNCFNWEEERKENDEDNSKRSKVK